MPVALHLTARTSASRGRLAARDLQRCNASGGTADTQWEHRVAELTGRDGPKGPVDLDSQETCLPELLAVLHQAQEVHVYGIDADYMLACLPYLKPDALRETSLFVHGPCAKLSVDLRNSTIARLEAWPGPVHYDQAASICLEKEQASGDVAPIQFYLDPWSSELTPRQGPDGPIEGLAPDDAVIVCLSRNLSESTVTALRPKVEGYFNEEPAGVDVAWIDEREHEPQAARGYRRLAQLCVADSWSDPICLEAMLSRTPLWVQEASDCPLAPWLAQLGVTRAEHEMPSPDAPDFESKWRSAIARWAKGEALQAPQSLRDRVAEHCVTGT